MLHGGQRLTTELSRLGAARRRRGAARTLRPWSCCQSLGSARSLTYGSGERSRWSYYYCSRRGVTASANGSSGDLTCVVLVGSEFSCCLWKAQFLNIQLCRQLVELGQVLVDQLDLLRSFM
jgi:hypothetical protein